MCFHTTLGDLFYVFRTFESVQRFLIQKDSTGYYVVGGRCFNSMDDIIDRYKKEVILDGLKLQLPLPPVHIQLHVCVYYSLL